MGVTINSESNTEPIVGATANNKSTKIEQLRLKYKLLKVLFFCHASTDVQGQIQEEI